MTSNPRYAGKPLLRLLELYVLWAIGELSDQDEKTLIAMTPKLQSTFKVLGTWHEVIAAAVRIPGEMPAGIRCAWAKNTEIARQNGETLTPQRFAEMFVDANLLR